MKLANTLAYYNTAPITAVKSFIVEVGWAIWFITLFRFQLESHNEITFELSHLISLFVRVAMPKGFFSTPATVDRNKLECLSLESFPIYFNISV
jgi:hypothetical protein